MAQTSIGIVLILQMAMSIRRWGAITALWVLSMLLSRSAQAGSVSGLTPLQLQRFSRDLVPSEPNFFREGRSQFEREIRRLGRHQPSEPLLQINPQVQCLEPASQRQSRSAAVAKALRASCLKD